MKKRIKPIIAAVLCCIAVLWLIPTVFVHTTIAEISRFESVSENQNTTTYKIYYTYERDGKMLEGHYKAKYNSDLTPLIGEQDACHYLTIPPYPVFIGNPASPVPPLTLLVIGVLVYVLEVPKKFRKKKGDTHESEA